MKLIKSRLCRRRYKVQTKFKWWLKGSRWGWDTGGKKEKTGSGKNEN